MNSVAVVSSVFWNYNCGFIPYVWPWQRRRFLYFKGVRLCTAATTSDLIEKTKDSNSIASTHLRLPCWNSTVRVVVWRRGIFYLGISSHVEKRRGRGTRRSWMASLPQPREKSWFIAEKKEGEGGERVKEEEDSFLLTYLAKSVSLYKRRRKNCLLVRHASQGDDSHEDEPGRKFCSVFRRTILDFFFGINWRTKYTWWKHKICLVLFQ